MLGADMRALTRAATHCRWLGSRVRPEHRASLASSLAPVGVVEGMGGGSRDCVGGIEWESHPVSCRCLVGSTIGASVTDAVRERRLSEQAAGREMGKLDSNDSESGG